MALGRNWRLRAGADQRTGASERFRYQLADCGGPVDPGSSGLSTRRYLFLTQGGRTVDVVIVAGAGAVCDELPAGGLGRAGDSRRGQYRRNLRAAHSYSRPPHPCGLCGRYRGDGDVAFDVTFSGAAARAGAAVHARVGGRAEVRERARRGAVAVAAAVARVV